jgi:hypothetical protein
MRKNASALETSIGAASFNEQSEILSQGDFRDRADRLWGKIDRVPHSLNECQAIKEDYAGNVVVLTNDTDNNLIAYSPDRGHQMLK